ncbi:MAG: GPR endopeptidase [Velocimicrobium sp.]
MIRTDLALEARESFPEDDVEVKGVILEEEEEGAIKITRLEIKDERAAKAMGKPVGIYITIEVNDMEEDMPGVEDLICRYIMELTGGIKNKHIMVAGLGNREVTPDALGPKVVDALVTTRHLIREFGDDFKNKYHLEALSAIAPGVMAQTGMESSEILSGIAKETNPDCLLVIDALAARSINRLNRTIQITNTGISPGAGVGNNRRALNEKSLGIKVIALGVPTVVDAHTIVVDRMQEVLSLQGFSNEESEQFIKQISSKTMKNMFVTPKDIDESVNRMSKVLADAFNQLFYPI